ncbi:MAG TPA: CHRD domain-containing protein, partial [Streptosporangiaceae bacterium]|nr:CHRD domain-containing protein [Streptosporangiaceae bacterium]
MRIRLLPALALLAGASTLTAVTALTPAAASIHRAAAVHDGYVFATYGSNGDKAFNRLLGINDNDEIAGYFGAGTQSSPDSGYTIVPPYGQANYTSENIGGPVSTQVTGLNNAGLTVGFIAFDGSNSAWYDNNGVFFKASYPTSDPASPPVDQLLGVNGHDVAVGFYTSGQGYNRGYTFDIATGKYAKVQQPGHGGASLTATGINLAGDISGFIAKDGTREGFIKAGTSFTILKVPGSSSTMALGLNNSSEVVGSYTTGTGSKPRLHGFTWTKKHGYVTVDDPAGAGTTTVNGVNSEGDLVGFYTTDNGHDTRGFLAIPAATQTKSVTLRPMPVGTVTLSHNDAAVADGDIDVIFSFSNAYGFTPNSVHNLALDTGSGSPVVFNQPLTANSAGQADGSIQTDYPIANLNPGDRILVLNGNDNSPAGNEPVAETAPLQSGQVTYKLTPVEVTSGGTSYGTPAGKATLTYNPVAQTLTITVTASGLTPGAHAAHVHVGSCQNQGGVLYMLKDLVA